MSVKGCLAILFGLALSPSYVSAQQVRQVGGHIGVATSFVTVTSRSDPATGKSAQTFDDRVPLVIPIGISIHTSDTTVVDFETQVALKLHPAGSTDLNIAPGIVSNFGPAAAGIRLVLPIGATPSAVGLIPLINKGIANLGFGTWFIEGAFPIVYHGSGPGADAFVSFDVVLHTGIGF
jgi:hypothetical protein